MSSSEGDHTADMALDGNINTYASTDGREIKFWRADFEGGEKVVKEVKIRNRNMAGENSDLGKFGTS